jgi:hypothetical protein
MWLSWHADLGDVLVLPPLASLIVALVVRRPHPDTPAMLASRVALLILVIAIVATGHASGDLLAIHIPAAVAVVGLIFHQLHQAVLSTQAMDHQPKIGAWEPPPGQKDA